MGRNIKKESQEIKKHFFATTNGKESKCNLCVIERIIPGTHSGNLKKHLKRNHPEELENIEKRLRVDKNSNTVLVQENLDQFVSTTKTIQLKLSREQMIDIYIELVTINGFPLRAVEASSLKKIFDPINKTLGLTINRRNIRDHVHKKAELYRNKIKNEVKNKIISLKVDCATRLDRSILGVNIQFEQDNSIQIRTLAVTEMHETHTGENLRNKIVRICKDYDISIDQIYTFTSDNAKNMIKTSELLSIFKDSENDTNSSDEEDGNDIITLYEVDEDDLNFAVMQSKNSILVSIKCIVHTLQLALNDVLQKTEKYVKLIAKAVQVVIKLRTPTILSMLKTRKLKKPMRNVITRWSSTFKMIERLIELKPFCIEMEEVIKELSLKQAEWQKLEEIKNILKYAYDATIRLQSEQLLLSEAFAIIYKCKLQLSKKISILFAKDLLFSLSQRIENTFSKSGPILAAVFLDPRYQSLLTSTEKRIAKEHLKDLYQYMVSNSNCLTIVEPRLESERQNENLDNSNSDTDTDHEEDVLATYIQSKNINRNNHNLTCSFSVNENILSILDSYDGMQLMPIETNVFHFWSGNHDIQLSKLAKIVLAVPGTQVSVERLFSVLKWILSDKRNNIAEEILEDTLVIIANSKSTNKD